MAKTDPPRYESTLKLVGEIRDIVGADCRPPVVMRVFVDQMRFHGQCVKATKACVHIFPFVNIRDTT